MVGGSRPAGVHQLGSWCCPCPRASRSLHRNALISAVRAQRTRRSYIGADAVVRDVLVAADDGGTRGGQGEAGH